MLMEYFPYFRSPTFQWVKMFYISICRLPFRLGIRVSSDTARLHGHTVLRYNSHNGFYNPLRMSLEDRDSHKLGPKTYKIENIRCFKCTIITQRLIKLTKIVSADLIFKVIHFVFPALSRWHALSKLFKDLSLLFYACQ